MFATKTAKAKVPGATSLAAIKAARAARVQKKQEEDRRARAVATIQRVYRGRRERRLVRADKFKRRVCVRGLARHVSRQRLACPLKSVPVRRPLKRSRRCF